MKKLTSDGFSVIEGVIIGVVITVVGLGGWYVFERQASKKEAAKTAEIAASDAAAKSSTDSSLETSKSETPQGEQAPYQQAPLREITLEQYGTSFKLPSDWVEGGGSVGTSIGYQGVDQVNKIYITLEISRDYPEALKCFLIAKDSEDMTYDNPLPGQRTVTKLTFSTTDPQAKTMCGVMITGAYSAKAGDVFDPYNKTLQDSLPNNRIVAYISSEAYTDPITNQLSNWPKMDVLAKSPKYAELIAALKSIQVK